MVSSLYKIHSIQFAVYSNLSLKLLVFKKCLSCLWETEIVSLQLCKRLLYRMYQANSEMIWIVHNVLYKPDPTQILVHDLVWVYGPTVIDKLISYNFMLLFFRQAELLLSIRN